MGLRIDYSAKVDFFVDLLAALDGILDIIFAAMLAYLVIRFTRPYTVEEHRRCFLAFCSNRHILNKVINNGHRMMAAERMLQIRKEDADRMMLHLLAQTHDTNHSYRSSYRTNESFFETQEE